MGARYEFTYLAATPGTSISPVTTTVMNACRC